MLCTCAMIAHNQWDHETVTSRASELQPGQQLFPSNQPLHSPHLSGRFSVACRGTFWGEICLNLFNLRQTIRR